MSEWGLSTRQRTIKRAIDLCVAVMGLFATWWVIVLAVLIATLDTRAWGLYTQTRVGMHGRTFRVMKVRTMRPATAFTTTVTSSNDVRLTRVGRQMRRYKLDELPQLINVIRGEMSLVGPRPDVPGFADRLTGDERLVLTVRPGITGPAALAYREEEALLASVADPETYNREVIYPDKVRINVDYVRNYSLMNDLRCLTETLAGTFTRPTQAHRDAEEAV